LIVQGAHEGWDAIETRALRGPPAALPGNNLKALIAEGANHQGLHKALAADGGSELLKGLFIKVLARLEGASLELFDG
jgi:hypothetical protein